MSNYSPTSSLIVGCGYLGTYTAKRLLSADHTVYSINRHHRDDLPTSQLLLDLSQPLSATAIDSLPEVEQVIFMISADGYSKAAYAKAYLEAQQHLLAVLPQTKLRHYIFISSTTVYAEEKGRPVQDDSPVTYDHFAAQIIRDAEKYAPKQLPPQVTHTAIRLAGIYGPDRLKRFSNILAAIQEKQPVLPAEDYYLNSIHVIDAARIILFTLEQQLSGIILGAEPTCLKKSELIKQIAEQRDIILNCRSVPQQSQRCIRNKQCMPERLQAHGFQWHHSLLETVLALD